MLERTSGAHNYAAQQLAEQAQADAAAAGQAVHTLEAAIQAGQQQCAALEQQFDDMQSWAALYDRCDMAMKKMIVSRMMSAVRVKREYEVEIERADAWL